LRRNLLLGLAASGAGLALFAWSRSIPLSLCAGALAGFGLIVYVASTNTLLQLTTEDRFRGRVMSLYTLMFAGTAPIGALGSGAIAQRWGAPVSTSVSAVVMLIGAVLVAWRFTVLARLQSDRVAEPAPTERLG
jgi:MFS family permease